MNAGSDLGLRVKEGFLIRFYNGLKVTNGLVKECLDIGDKIRLRQSNVTIDMQTPIHHFEVATVATKNPQPLQLQYTLKDKTTNTISGYSKLWEPLSYPLLFPYGEYGWEKKWLRNQEVKLSLQKYLCSRILMPERNLNILSKEGTHMLRMNRFTMMSRLGQYYIVDNMSRMLDMRLAQYRSDDYQHSVYKDDAEWLSGESTKSFLSSSYFGGARYLKNNAQDALTLVSELGPPTFFVTLTCNPGWKVLVYFANSYNMMFVMQQHDYLLDSMLHC